MKEWIRAKLRALIVWALAVEEVDTSSAAAEIDAIQRGLK